MRFCFISSFYPPYSFGGDAIYVRNLAEALARREHEVDVIHCVDSFNLLARGEPVEPLSKRRNITIHSLRSRLGGLSPLVAQQTGKTWPKTNAILEVLFSKKFDIIHYHNISLLGPEVLWLRPDYQDFIKLYTMHEHWLICPMHVLWKYNERPCDNSACFRCTLSFRRPPQWWRYTHLLKKCVASVDTFISPSRFAQACHEERGFKLPISRLPNFVPEAIEAIQPDVSPHPRPYFLYVGRLEKIKGIETLFPAFDRFRHIDLLIAGAGTYDAELRGRARQMRNVLFLGLLPQAKLAPLYRNAIALLLPSVGHEVFPLVILEAFQQRTPVIAHAVGGVREVVEESGGGLLYADAEGMLTALDRLINDTALRRTLGDRAYRAYRQKWNEESHLDGYFQLLEQVSVQKLGTAGWKVPSRGSLYFPRSLPSVNIATHPAISRRYCPSRPRSWTRYDIP